MPYVSSSYIRSLATYTENSWRCIQIMTHTWLVIRRPRLLDRPYHDCIGNCFRFLSVFFRLLWQLFPIVFDLFRLLCGFLIALAVAFDCLVTFLIALVFVSDCLAAFFDCSDKHYRLLGSLFRWLWYLVVSAY